jgi:hypothetical protein
MIAQSRSSICALMALGRPSLVGGSGAAGAGVGTGVEMAGELSAVLIRQTSTTRFLAKRDFSRL